MKQNQITAFSTIFEALFSEQQLNSLGVQTHMIERFRLITPAKTLPGIVCVPWEVEMPARSLIYIVT